MKENKKQEEPRTKDDEQQTQPVTKEIVQEEKAQKQEKDNKVPPGWDVIESGFGFNE